MIQIIKVSVFCVLLIQTLLQHQKDPEWRGSLLDLPAEAGSKRGTSASDPKHCRAANFTLGFCRGFTIFHGNFLSVLAIAF